MLFNEYPYMNLTDINLDWIIRMIKKLRNDIDDFVNINTIKYADPIIWDITKQYEMNTVVVDGLDGTAYISTRPVPVGVAVTNPDYWTVIFNYGESIADLKSTIAHNEGISTTATEAMHPGNLAYVLGGLYKVTTEMPAGTAYIVGSNIIEYTIEEYLLDLSAAISAEAAAREAAITAEADAREAAIDAEAEAREAAITAEAGIRSEADEALSERFYYVLPAQYGAVGDGVTDDTAAIQAALNSGKPVNLDGKSYKLTSIVNMLDNTYIWNGALIFENPIRTLYGNTKKNITLEQIDITVADYEGSDEHNRTDWFPLDFHDSARIVLQDCIIHCNDCRSVGFYGCSDILVDHCYLDSIEGTSITFRNCTNVKVLKCEFDGRNQYDNSWHTTDVYGKGANCDNVLFEDCYFHHYRGCAIQFTSTPGTYNIYNAKVRNCVMKYWNDVGIKIDGVNATVIVEDCIFDTNNYYGDAHARYPLSLGGLSGLANDVIVRNNIFRNMVGGYMIAENLEGIIQRLYITGNKFYGTSGTVARIFKFEAGYGREIIFEDNVVEYIGINVQMLTTDYPSKSFIRFNRNTIRTNGDDYDMNLAAGYVEFCNNYIGTDAAPRTHIYASAARVENNQIAKETAYAGNTFILRGPCNINTLFINGNRVDTQACGVESDVTPSTTVSYQIAT